MSKKAKHTFSGYSFAQLKRIQTHRGYLLTPPAKKPERAEFGLPEHSVIAPENQNALLSLPDDFIREESKDLVVREKQFKQALNEWKSWKKWEAERNAKRRDLEAKFGYDCKHATHLVRLIRQAKEILTEGTIHVFRPDREELLAIRNGAWSYEKLVAYAQDADQELNELYEKSTLRDKPDHKGIADLYVEVCEREYGIKLG